MKTSEIEKQLKKEIREAAASDFSNIASKCNEKEVVFEKRPVVEHGIAPKNESSHSIKNTVIALLTALVLALAGILLINQLRNESKGGSFIIDINPSLEIVYNENTEVTQINALNEDAEVLLCNMELVGKSYKEAVGLLMDNCVKLGYLSPSREDNAIMTTALLENGEKNEDMTQEIKELFYKEFENRRMHGVVIAGFENSELKQEAEKYGIDTQKYSLIQEYLSLGGELEEKEYAKTSIRELYSFIYQKNKEEKTAKIESLNSKANEIDRELLDALSNVNKLIASKIENLSSIEDVERYSSYIISISQYASQVGNNKDDKYQSVIQNVSAFFDNILEKETDAEIINLIKETKTDIEFQYEELSKAQKELGELNKTPQDKMNERLDKFSSDIKGDTDVILPPQPPKEEDYINEWNEYKEKWNEERKNDLSKKSPENDLSKTPESLVPDNSPTEENKNH